MVDQEHEEPAGELEPEPEISSWVFRERIPTVEEVTKLLNTLPPVWGVETVKFLDFIQPLPQRQKVKVKQGNREVDTYVNEYRLYMSVAGRIKMLEEAQRINAWTVSIEPEYVTVGESIVHRTRIEITTNENVSGEGMRVGTRSGTSKPSGGQYNFEKAETASQGRAIAAWGFGVLPGSGVASLEEMSTVSQGGPPEQREEEQPRASKGELTQQMLAVAEELRQLRGQSDAESHRKIAAYFKDKLFIDIVAEEDTDDDGKPYPAKFDFGKAKIANIQLALNAMTTSLREIRSAGQSV